MWAYVFRLGLIGQLAIVQMTASASNFKIVKMECITNQVYLRNVTCNLKPISWQKSVSNMDCDIVKEIRNFSLHMQLWVKNDANQYHPFLMNVTRNFCDILDRKAFPAYATTIMKFLRKVSNVNHSCPYTGHLTARNLYIDESWMRMPLPYATYKCVFRFLEGYPYEEIGVVAFYIEVTEKKKQRPRD